MFRAYLIDKQVKCFLYPCPTEGPIKSQLSVCLSIRLSIFQFDIFLRNLIFSTMVDSWNILKLTEAFFPGEN